MDERGYLLAHPNLLEPTEMASAADVEQQHLTHHEPLGTRSDIFFKKNYYSVLY